MKSKIFTELCDSINNYNNIQNYSEKEGAQMLQIITKCMFSFLEEIVKFGKYKDSFIYLYTLGPCIETIAKSNKTNTSYSFSYDLIRCEFFFYSDIHNGSNLRYIEESFLLDFFRVMNTYKIRYIQTQFCPEAEKNHPDLYRNKKGNLLPLMRNYYVETVYQDNNDSYYKADLSLGMFEVVWCLNDSVDEIFAEACLTMKWLYKFNYNLWKIENNKSKKRINNI